jgi:hypothetical protein
VGAVHVKETDSFPNVPVKPVGAPGTAITFIALEFADPVPKIVESVSTAR